MAPLDEIVNDLVEVWHANPRIHEVQPLDDFLGMTMDEGAEWARFGVLPQKRGYEDFLRRLYAK
jgi:hypothetical protein